ncbi:hypothetical protein ccbrp13_59810 [Ktedonobacteria bacterium brp13]|nr:hypothetical protein ccbrp13_59810 [Ktedonobacteria bacterium brp13]
MSSTKVVSTGDTSIGTLANLAADKTAHNRYIDAKALNTLRRQKADLTLFFQFLEAAHYTAPSAYFFQWVEEGRNQDAWSLWNGITHGLVEAFIEWMKQQGYAISSISVRLSTVKAYAKLAQRAGAISQQDLALILMVKAPTHREGVNIDKKREVKRVGAKKEAATIISPAHAVLLKRQPRHKDAAMMCLLLDLGLRVGGCHADFCGMKYNEKTLNSVQT